METLKAVSGIDTKKNNHTDICQDCKAGKMTRVPLKSLVKPHAPGKVIFLTYVVHSQQKVREAGNMLSPS